MVLAKILLSREGWCNLINCNSTGLLNFKLNIFKINLNLFWKTLVKLNFLNLNNKVFEFLFLKIYLNFV